MEVLQDTYRTINFGPQEYEVPNEWKVLKIKETSTLNGRIGWQGLTTKEYLKEGDYFLITGTDFKNGRIDWENCHFVDQDRFDQDTKIQIKKNDILITKDGTIGKVAIIASELSKPGTLNSGVFVLRPTNKDYLPIFMYYYLNSFFFSSFISQIKAGSTIAHLYQKDFEKYTFLVPSIQEQQKIAAILSTVDEQISTTDKIIEKSKELKKGLMQKLFSEGIGHTEFKYTKIGLNLEILNGFPAKSKYFNNESNGLPLIRIRNILKGHSETYYSGEFDSKYLIKKGDILIGMDGDFNIAKWTGVPSILNQRICKLIDAKAPFNLEYLYYYLEVELKKIQARTPSTTVKHLSIKDLRKVNAYCPPLSEQQKIADILSEADAKIEKEQEQKAQLEQLKKGLMQQLLTGKKRVKV